MKAQSMAIPIKDDTSSLHGYSQLDSPSKITGGSNRQEAWRQSAMQLNQSKSQEKPLPQMRPKGITEVLDDDEYNISAYTESEAQQVVETGSLIERQFEGEDDSNSVQKVLKDLEPKQQSTMPQKQSEKIPLKSKPGSKGSSIIDILESAPKSEFKKETLRTKKDL